MTYIGIDLSLTSTGVCVLNDNGYKVFRIEPKSLREWSRVDFILNDLWGVLHHSDTYRIFIEGYSFGSKGRAVFDIAECGGVVRYQLREWGHDYTDVPPSSLKKWATGKGNADKGLMLATAIRKFGYEGSSHDEADALLLAHYGRDVSH